MSLWQFAAVIEGWNRAHGAEEGPPSMTGDEFDALVEKHAAWLAR